MTWRGWMAPVVTVNFRQAARIRRQAQTIKDLRRDLKTQENRARRWRRTALELAPKVSPRAMDVCLLQVQSEEIEDLPEVRQAG